MSADWERWAGMISVPLWQAVALSLNYEPEAMPLNWRPIGGGVFDACPIEFKRRLDIAENHVQNRNLQCVSGSAKVPMRAVRLTTFAAWAANVKWDIPNEFPRDEDGVAGTVSQNGYVPPYIALMLKAVKVLHLDDNKKISSDTVRHWLRENWPEELSGYMSDEKISYMATFIRRPEDGRGGNSSWKAAEKKT